jgi:hypothetical protein
VVDPCHRFEAKQLLDILDVWGKRRTIKNFKKFNFLTSKKKDTAYPPTPTSPDCTSPYLEKYFESFKI